MIKFVIESENSSDHWSYFDTLNKNVLDLGCGRWYTEKKEELSPFYFARNASRVIGVDSNSSDIEFYITETQNDKKYSFEHIVLTDVQQFRDLITKYSVTAIKCDIEGYEVVMLDLSNKDLQSVTELAVEYHNHDLKTKYVEKVKEWGFEIKAMADFARTPDHLGVLFCEKKIL